MNTLYLYGTEDCLLCEKAADYLSSKNISFIFIDIVTDNELVEELGWFIPVIKYNEMIWKSPFDVDEIIKTLQSQTLYKTDI